MNINKIGFFLLLSCYSYNAVDVGYKGSKCTVTSLTNASELTNSENKRITYLEITNSNISLLTLTLTSIFPTLEKMSVENSNLMEIEVDAFGAKNAANLQQMKTLIVSKNNLSVLEKETFAGANKLEMLNLSRNQINYIAGGAFSNLSNLKVLDCHNNLITDLNDDLFEDLINMTELQLTHNRIKTINLKMFEKNSKLEIVSVEDNELIEIEATNGNQIIKKLFLRNNSLTCIPNLKSFSALEKVELSQNPKLNLKCIDFPQCLEELHLNEVNLMRTDFNITYLKALSTLKLKKNKLKKMNYTYWPKDGKLKKLDLSNNELTEIDGDGFEEVFAQNDVQIYIDGNDWNCTTLENFKIKYNSFKLYTVNVIDMTKMKENGNCLLGNYFPKRFQDLKNQITELDKPNNCIPASTDDSTTLIIFACLFFWTCILIFCSFHKLCGLKKNESTERPTSILVDANPIYNSTQHPTPGDNGIDSNPLYSSANTTNNNNLQDTGFNRTTDSLYSSIDPNYETLAMNTSKDNENVGIYSLPFKKQAVSPKQTDHNPIYSSDNGGDQPPVGDGIDSNPIYSSSNTTPNYTGISLSAIKNTRLKSNLDALYSDVVDKLHRKKTDPTYYSIRETTSQDNDNFGLYAEPFKKSTTGTQDEEYL